MSSVWQRGPRSKELQIQELQVQKLQEKGTLTSHVQKQRHYMILGMEEEKWEREETDKEEEESDTCAQKLEALGIFHNRSKGQRGMAPWTATTEVDNIHLEMETDTGSAKSIIGKDTFSRFFSEKQLNTKAPVLTTYSGEELPMKGTIEVTVKHNQQTHQLGLSVADVTGQPPILGREWLSQVKIDWPHVPHVSKTWQLGEVLAKHEPVFENGLGTMKQFKAKLHLKPHFLPKFIKARPVPFAVCPKEEAELEQLEKDGEPEFRVTQDQANADMLSQLPLEGDETATEELVFHTTVLEELPVTAEQIADLTRKDPVLSKVWTNTLNEWPNPVNNTELQPYFKWRHKLSVEGGLILWCLRVVIPTLLKRRILSELHEEHLEMFKMKALTMSYVWWPGIDQDIQTTVKPCQDCTRVANTPATAPLHLWSWPKRPWQLVHIDGLRRTSRAAFLCPDWCPLKVAGSDFHVKHHHREDHWHSLRSLCFLWTTGRNSQWQRTTVHCRSLFWLSSLEWG